MHESLMQRMGHHLATVMFYAERLPEPIAAEGRILLSEYDAMIRGQINLVSSDDCVR